jgi:hypothetical protein
MKIASIFCADFDMVASHSNLNPLPLRVRVEIIGIGGIIVGASPRL